MLMKRHLNVSIGYFYLNFIVFTQVTCEIINEKIINKKIINKKIINKK